MNNLNVSKMNKVIQLALKNPNENEAKVAASRFFKYLKGHRFVSTQWGLTGDDARRLMSLAGVKVKGVKEEVKVEPKAEPESKVMSYDTFAGYCGLIASLRSLLETNGEVKLSQICELMGMKATTARRKLRAVYGAGTRWVFTTDMDLVSAVNVLV